MTYEWHNMNINTIIGGIAPDGVLYLKTFLLDYKKEFSVNSVNPNCKKCLVAYLNDFKTKYSIMENNSNYVLKKKREGIALEFGSSVRVNNRNITDKYAEILMKRYDKDFLFDKYPEVKEEKTEATTENVEPKKKRTRKNRK